MNETLVDPQKSSAAKSRVARMLPFLLLAGTFACSDLSNGDDTYLSVATNGLQTQADWSCLGGPLPPPPTTYPQTVTYTFPFVEWLTDNPLPGRKIQVCNRFDTTCMQPLDVPTNIIEGQRNVSVQLPAGQNVFLVLSTSDPMILPEILYLDGPVYDDVQGGRIQMLTAPTVGALAQQLQLPLEQALGVLAIRAHDCNGTIVGGARYSINDTSGKTFPYTLVNGLPVADKPPTPGVSTTITSDNSPWAGFINVPPGGLTVFGILADGGREFGTADIQVRGGALNSVEIQARNRL